MTSVLAGTEQIAGQYAGVVRNCSAANLGDEHRLLGQPLQVDHQAGFF